MGFENIFKILFSEEKFKSEMIRNIKIEWFGLLCGCKAQTKYFIP